MFFEKNLSPYDPKMSGGFFLRWGYFNPSVVLMHEHMELAMTNHNLREEEPRNYEHKLRR